MDVVTKNLPFVGDTVIDSNDVVAHIERCRRRCEHLTVGGVRLRNDTGTEVRYCIRINRAAGIVSLGKGFPGFKPSDVSFATKGGVGNIAWHEDL